MRPSPAELSDKPIAGRWLYVAKTLVTNNYDQVAFNPDPKAMPTPGFLASPQAGPTSITFLKSGWYTISSCIQVNAASYPSAIYQRCFVGGRYIFNEGVQVDAFCRLSSAMTVWIDAGDSLTIEVFCQTASGSFVAADDRALSIAKVG